MVRFWVDPSVPKQQLTCTGKKFASDGAIKIRYGNRVVTCVVRNQPAAKGTTVDTGAVSVDDGQVRMSSQLQKTLRLPSEGKLHFMPENGAWRLGPILGVYVTKEKNPQRMFGEQTRLLEDLTRYAEEECVDIVVLTPGFKDYQRGWRYDTGLGTWRESLVTLPDVVLRRSGTFHEQGAKVAADLNAFQRSGRLHSLPRHSSNKWTFYRVMQENSKLRSYLPATVRVTSATELKTALQQMKDAYLKPMNGAQGVCIHRLQLRNGGTIVMAREDRVVPRQAERLSTRFRPDTRLVTSELHGDTELQSFWHSIQDKFHKWVLQESVHLLHTTDDRPVDFRWLVQYTDGPKVIGRVARVGSPGAITTNLHTGGKAMDAKQVLELLPNVDTDKTLADMDTLALGVVEQLRHAFGPFAEVGIDIGIDESGKVVAFEVNPTPGRRMLRSLSDNVRKLSLVTLVEYAIKAAGFENGK
ncbi:YheC/YheD family endospore coat-associated protein [Alicyclobacillus mengziensis]|uniref:YheC/YheD family protein n=1 Tax=Alicyclobacillus mengziensis TaxID=2931921 RepID=A0A9X7VX90_9BACL|nr:YheC/YheD family protein [Alicyclobacillus mengziensis]QSO45413.1 YheC/YheD family protein [Alicyclobacillus mengziensis]